MKDFAKNLLTRICVYFTVAMTLWLITGLIFAGPIEGIVISLSFLIACAVMALLQACWFTDRFLKKPGYPLRLLGFGVTGFIALAACAWLGDWIPRDIPAAWITFTIIYLVLLVLFTALFSVIYRKQIARYSRALEKLRCTNDPK